MRARWQVEQDLDKCADWEAVANLPYDRSTLPWYRETTAEISIRYRDWRSAAVKSALKPQLAETIRMIVARTRDELAAELSLIIRAEEIRLAAEDEKQLQRKRYEFMLRVAPHGRTYIAGFDDPKEGIRAWDCLVELMDDGTVTEENLADYGIIL